MRTTITRHFLGLPIAVFTLTFALVVSPSPASAQCSPDYGIVFIDYFPDGDGIGYCDASYQFPRICEQFTCWGETSDHPEYYYGTCWRCNSTYESAEPNHAITPARKLGARGRSVKVLPPWSPAASRPLGGSPK